jgi:hypothetical protein
VLFAIPLAVALFLVLMKLAIPNTPIIKKEKNNILEIKNSKSNTKKPINKEEPDSSLIYLLNSRTLKIK